MEFKMFVKLMIVVIPLFGAVSSHTIQFPEAMCPEFTKQFCACNGTEKAKLVPMRMCFEGNECNPCPMDLQDQIDCSICPGNTCPVCSENEFSFLGTDKKESADVKTLFARSARKSRHAWDPLPHDSWCVFDRHMLNGQVECTFTTYSKECLLSCYEPYSVNGRKELAFACKRKENVWKPEIQSCEDKSGGYNAPEIPKEPEEPQQPPKIPEMLSVPEPKAKYGNVGINDFQFGDERGAGAGAAPEDDEYYDSDDDGKDPVAQSGKENAAALPIIKDALHKLDGLSKGSSDQIDEGVMKDFYDLLNSE